jgi:hypothetical protein
MSPLVSRMWSQGSAKPAGTDPDEAAEACQPSTEASGSLTRPSSGLSTTTSSTFQATRSPATMLPSFRRSDGPITAAGQRPQQSRLSAATCMSPSVDRHVLPSLLSETTATCGELPDRNSRRPVRGGRALSAAAAPLAWIASTAVSRLRNTSAAAGCGERRPPKTLAFWGIA